MSHAQQTDTKSKLNQLNFLLGSWEVEVNTRLSANGPWENSHATSSIAKTLKASIIEENFSGKREGKEFLIKTLFAINNSNNKFQRVFADSEHSVLIEFEGDKNSDTIFFDKTWVYATGSTVKLRVAYHPISNDEFDLINMRMPQNSFEWDITGRMKYKRIK